jgi:peptidyl-prolyl cis-trans isomerase SurA
VGEEKRPAEIGREKGKAERSSRERQDGADFQQMAIAESDSQDALQGGDIGWRRPGEISPEFAKVLEGMEPGDISKPLRSPAGFYLIKLVDERAAQAMMVPEKRARHIIIQPDELTSDQNAYEKIREIREKIVEGEAGFAEMAEEHSDDPVTSSKGGDLGWFGPNEYGSRIDDMVSQLEVGQLSQPFRTEGGWHIIELLDTRQVDRTDDMRRRRAEQSIRNRKGQEEIENWVRQLRSRAYVDIRLPGA